MHVNVGCIGTRERRVYRYTYRVSGTRRVASIGIRDIRCVGISIASARRVICIGRACVYDIRIACIGVRIESRLCVSCEFVRYERV